MHLIARLSPSIWTGPMPIASAIVTPGPRTVSVLRRHSINRCWVNEMFHLFQEIIFSRSPCPLNGFKSDSSIFKNMFWLASLIYSRDIRHCLLWTFFLTNEETEFRNTESSKPGQSSWMLQRSISLLKRPAGKLLISNSACPSMPGLPSRRPCPCTLTQPTRFLPWNVSLQLLFSPRNILSFRSAGEAVMLRG